MAPVATAQKPMRKTQLTTTPKRSWIGLASARMPSSLSILLPVPNKNSAPMMSIEIMNTPVRM